MAVKNTTVLLEKGCVIDGKKHKKGENVTLPTVDAKYLVGSGTAKEAKAKEDKSNK